MIQLLVPKSPYVWGKKMGSDAVDRNRQLYSVALCTNWDDTVTTTTAILTYNYKTAFWNNLQIEFGRCFIWQVVFLKILMKTIIYGNKIPSVSKESTVFWSRRPCQSRSNLINDLIMIFSCHTVVLILTAYALCLPRNMLYAIHFLGVWTKIVEFGPKQFQKRTLSGI